jgi:putative ABC transport system ATP-binding protein
VHALSDVSFVLEEGAILCIVGHNGSGKTTLLNCVRRTYPIDSGSILIGGAPLNGRHTVASVYQDVSIGVVPSMTAFENLSLVQSTSGNRFLWTIPARRYRSAIREFLEEADLLERFRAFENTPVSEMSGGQRQQLAIVCAMMRRPKPNLLLLDEFVASLDPTIREEILQWTKTWIRRRALTTLMVTHDHALAESWGDLVLELTDGRVTRFSVVGGQPAEA